MDVCKKCRELQVVLDLQQVLLALSLRTAPSTAFPTRPSSPGIAVESFLLEWAKIDTYAEVNHMPRVSPCVKGGVQSLPVDTL